MVMGLELFDRKGWHNGCKTRSRSFEWDIMIFGGFCQKALLRLQAAAEAKAPFTTACKYMLRTYLREMDCYT